MPRSRKAKCGYPECQDLQDGYVDCKLCTKHSAFCLCAYHRQKRKREQKEQDRALKKAMRETEAKRVESKTVEPKEDFQFHNINEEIDEDVNNMNEDGNMNEEIDEDVESLDSDGNLYLRRLESPRMWTFVHEDCICFPDFIIGDGTGHGCKTSTDVQLDLNVFIHAYSVRRTFGASSHVLTATDCGCPYIENFEVLLLGGFDTSSHTLAELLTLFEVGSPCIHARYTLITNRTKLFDCLISTVIKVTPKRMGIFNLALTLL
jgi:hypothetical protein